MADKPQGSRPALRKLRQIGSKNYSLLPLGVSFLHVLCLVHGGLSRKKATYIAIQ